LGSNFLGSSATKDHRGEDAKVHRFASICLLWPATPNFLPFDHLLNDIADQISGLPEGLVTQVGVSLGVGADGEPRIAHHHS
jgi:hypothetical protein